MSPVETNIGGKSQSFCYRDEHVFDVVMMYDYDAVYMYVKSQHVRSLHC